MTPADLICAYIALNAAIAVTVAGLIAIEALAPGLRSRALLSLHYAAAGFVVTIVVACSLLPEGAMWRLWWPETPVDIPAEPMMPGTLSNLGWDDASLDAGSVGRVWIAAVLALLAFGSLRLVRDFRALHALRRESHCVRRHGKVRLWFSDRITVPLSYWLPGSAHVVVPSTLIEQPLSVRMVVAHELQHHRQRDTCWLYFFRTLTWICWFNPFVHWWNRRLDRLQEYACDEALTARTAWSVTDYAQCLLNVAVLESRGDPRHALATHFIRFGDPNALTRRIEKMFEQKRIALGRSAQLAMSCGLAVIIGVAAYGATSAAQAATPDGAASTAVTWPVENGQVTAGFGGKHEGVDIAAAAGSPVLAFATGKVVGRDVGKHCGEYVRIRHENATTTLYCNLTDISVQTGDRVDAGTRVGAIAAPASGTRPHVHFELKVGDQKVDPLKHLPRETA